MATSEKAKILSMSRPGRYGSEVTRIDCFLFYTAVNVSKTVLIIFLRPVPKKQVFLTSPSLFRCAGCWPAYTWRLQRTVLVRRRPHCAASFSLPLWPPAGLPVVPQWRHSPSGHCQLPLPHTPDLESERERENKFIQRVSSSSQSVI